MTFQTALRQLRQQLIPIYGEREAAMMASMAIEKLSGFRRADLLIHGEKHLDIRQQFQYEEWLKDLMATRPLQYVLGEAWFAGMSFMVDERVLIPRPETEELVDWIKATTIHHLPPGSSHLAHATIHPSSTVHHSPPVILDIGTGSGCIAIALKKIIADAIVWAIDISADALQLAMQNSNELEADIRFLQMDILQADQTSTLPQFDIIVSNPPYIPASDSQTLEAHVRDFEPSLALFVAEDDPLLFYREIAVLGLAKLKPLGSLFFEVHEDYAQETQSLVASMGYRDIELKQDLQGKWRMLRAFRAQEI